jgi:hypothetical protein
MPPFEAQPRIIFESPTGKAEPFRHVRRQSRSLRAGYDVSRSSLMPVGRLEIRSAVFANVV